MFQFSLQDLALYGWPAIISSATVLFIAWLGSLLQRAPERLQRWCEGAIAASIIAIAFVLLPIPRPAIFWSIEQADLNPQTTSLEIGSSPSRSGQQNSGLPIAAESPMTSKSKTLQQSDVPSRRSIDLPAALTIGYLAGAGCCIAFLLIGRMRLGWIESASRRLTPKTITESDFPLFVSPRASRPFCVGIFDPRIILPEVVAGSHHRPHVIRHESVHLHRRDALPRLMMNLAMPVLYVNPVYWILRRSAILASERIADSRAAESSSVDSYTAGMIELARVLTGPRQLISVASGWSGQTSLTKRFRWLLSDRRDERPCNRLWSSLISLAMLGLVSAVTLIFGCNPQDTQHSEVQHRNDSNAGSIWSMTADLPGIIGSIKDCETQSVSGRVTADGEPVPNASVWASGYGRIGGREKVFTDDQGRFRLRLPIDSRMAIDSWHVAAFKDNQFGHSVDRSGSDEATIEIMSGRELKVEIRDRASDALISDSRLFLDDGRIIDSPDGMLVVRGLPRKLYRFVVAATGFERRLVQTDLYSSHQDRFVVRLSRGANLHGQVVDKAGEPVKDNPIGMGVGSRRLAPAMRQLTDGNGRFLLPGLPANRPVRVTAYSHAIPGGSSWESMSVTIAEGASKEVRFTVEGDHAPVALNESPGIRSLTSDQKDTGRGAVHGRVLLPDGQPATEFELSFHWPRDWKPGEEIVGGMSVGNNCLYTQSNGRFDYTGLKQGGTYRLVAASPGYQDAVASRVHAVVISELENAPMIEMKLNPASDLTVTVFDQQRQSVESADVWLVPSDPNRALEAHQLVRRRMHATSGPDGTATFHAVPFPDGVLIIEKEAMGTERVPWYGDDVTVTLAKESALIVQIDRPKSVGDPVTVYLQRDGSNSLTAQVADANETSVTFQQIPHGKYHLSIESDDYRLRSGEWKQAIGNVAPGSTKTVKLDLKHRTQ